MQMQRFLEISEAPDPQALERRLVEFTHALDFGLVLAVEGERVRLRALATGRVWDAPLPAVRQVSAREELSMRLAAANARAGSRI